MAPIQIQYLHIKYRQYWMQWYCHVVLLQGTEYNANIIIHDWSIMVWRKNHLNMITLWGLDSIMSIISWLGLRLKAIHAWLELNTKDQGLYNVNHAWSMALYLAQDGLIKSLMIGISPGHWHISHQTSQVIFHCWVWCSEWRLAEKMSFAPWVLAGNSGKEINIYI